MASNGIQIGKVSEQTGLSIDAIRFYEKQRLLESPPRTEGGFRLFHTRDIERIRFIRRAQQLGFSLPEIRELLLVQREDGEACSHIRELANLERQLTKRLRKCERSLRASADAHEDGCPMLEEFARRGSDGR